MIPTLITFAGWLGVTERLRKAAAWGMALFAILLLCGAVAGSLIWLRAKAYADGQRDLLAEQADDRAKAEAAQRVRERLAAGQAAADVKAGAKTDAAQAQEKTDATAHLPDARPSDRQRARACVELQRQARAAGQPVPAC